MCLMMWCCVCDVFWWCWWVSDVGWWWCLLWWWWCWVWWCLGLNEGLRDGDFSRSRRRLKLRSGSGWSIRRGTKVISMMVGMLWMMDLCCMSNSEILKDVSGCGKRGYFVMVTRRWISTSTSSRRGVRRFGGTRCFCFSFGVCFVCDIFSCMSKKIYVMYFVRWDSIRWILWWWWITRIRASSRARIMIRASNSFLRM